MKKSLICLTFIAILFILVVGILIILTSHNNNCQDNESSLWGVSEISEPLDDIIDTVFTHCETTNTELNHESTISETLESITTLYTDTTDSDTFGIPNNPDTSEANPETTVPEENSVEETTAEETTKEETSSPPPETTVPEETASPPAPDTTAPTLEENPPWYLILVNIWNALPQDYSFELTSISNNYKVDSRCADALNKMLSDCRAAGNTPIICSAYRSYAEQSYLYEERVKLFISRGYTEEGAKARAAQSVAIPGTSEHQLGLAVDIVCSTYPYTDRNQANTPTQKWLMENCYKYGFIMRYPIDTTNITGIKYEPWHYRYVGIEAATEIHKLGITLEEYLSSQ